MGDKVPFLSLFMHFCHYSFSLSRIPELDFAYLHVLGTEKPELTSKGLSGYFLCANELTIQISLIL